jgi:tyrosyl-tRNA synthetase
MLINGHSVKNKMKNGDGMSFAEFTYPILQSWDWWHMYNTLGIRMQIGGSDQYGNITAGVDAVKYIAETHPAPDTPKKTSDPPFGLTVPLLTTSSGSKFGKTAGNAVWLDSSMTSTFELYGKFVNTADADVGKYLKLFTFMKLEDIDELVKKHMETPSRRIAQHKLASEIVELVHGREAAADAAKQHKLVFGGGSKPPVGEQQSDVAGRDALSLPQVNMNNRPAAQMKLPRTLIETASIGKIVFASGLAESASEGHRLAMKQAVYIGGAPTQHKAAMDDGAVSFAPVKLWKPEETKQYIIGENLLILRRGKHNIRTIEIVDDEVYAQSGLEYPGQKEFEATVRGRQINEEYRKRQEREASGQTDTEPETEPPLEGVEAQWAEVEKTIGPDTVKLLRDAGLTPEEALQDGPDADEFENIDPEARLKLLNRRFEDELAVRQAKIDAKNAPKPKFTGHFKKSRIYSHVHGRRG